MPLQILDVNGRRVVRIVRKAPIKKEVVSEESVRPGPDPGNGRRGDLPGRRRTEDQPLSDELPGGGTSEQDHHPR